MVEMAAHIQDASVDLLKVPTAADEVLDLISSIKWKITEKKLSVVGLKLHQCQEK